MVCRLKESVEKMSLVPVLTLQSQSANKISDEIGKNKSICIFFADTDILKWEARAVKGTSIPLRGEGVLVEKGGFLKANEKGQIIVDYNELTNGDGQYTISIYAQGLNGYWSDGTFVDVFVGFKYNNSRNYNNKWKYNCKTYQ